MHKDIQYCVTGSLWENLIKLGSFNSLINNEVFMQIFNFTYIPVKPYFKEFTGTVW